MAIDVDDVVTALYHAVGEDGEGGLDLIADALRSSRDVVAPPVRAALLAKEPFLQSRKDPTGASLYSLTAAGVWDATSGCPLGASLVATFTRTAAKGSTSSAVQPRLGLDQLAARAHP